MAAASPAPCARRRPPPAPAQCAAQHSWHDCIVLNTTDISMGPSDLRPLCTLHPCQKVMALLSPTPVPLTCPPPEQDCRQSPSRSCSPQPLAAEAVAAAMASLMLAAGQEPGASGGPPTTPTAVVGGGQQLPVHLAASQGACEVRYSVATHECPCPYCTKDQCASICLAACLSCRSPTGVCLVQRPPADGAGVGQGR
jgi:hypothetical protein